MIRFFTEWLANFIALIISLIIMLLVIAVIVGFIFFLVGGPALFVSEPYQNIVAFISSVCAVLSVFLLVTCPTFTVYDYDEY
jgi:hypothetical protein